MYALPKVLIKKYDHRKRQRAGYALNNNNNTRYI
jgi:hypothetical protein